MIAASSTEVSKIEQLGKALQCCIAILQDLTPFVARTTWRQTARQPVHRRVVHGLLAGAVRIQGLRKEHRHGLGRGKQSFSMWRQQRFDFIEQVRPGQ